MPAQEAILEKLKNDTPLTDEDKTAIYAAEAFDDPDSKIGNTTTLLHQIAILPNAHEIFLTLDISQLTAAINTIDGSAAGHTPLSFLAAYLAYESIDPRFYQDIICDLVKYSGEFVMYVKSDLEGYGWPGERVLKAIEKCEGTTSASSAASSLLEGHDAEPALVGEAGEYSRGPAAFWHF